MTQFSFLQEMTIGLDAAPLIYFVERHPTYSAAVTPFFEGLASGHYQAITSVVSLLEVLVHPIRDGDIELARRYRSILLNNSEINTYPVTPEISEQAAQIRAIYPRVQPADALHLATSVVAGAQYFLTNDKALPNLPTLQMLVVDDLGQA